jgi:photosystem II stability/assembly factor-like uncharacterized protein
MFRSLRHGQRDGMPFGLLSVLSAGFTLASVLVLSCCEGCTPVQIKPLISWDNFDFQKGLGNPVPSASGQGKGFVQVPIAAGALCEDILFQPSTSTLWAGTQGPVLSSTDGGDTWAVLPESAKGKDYPKDFCIDPQGCLWLRTPCEVFRVSDQGTVWHSVYRGPDDFSGCANISDLSLRGNFLWVSCRDTGTIARIDTRDSTVAQTYRNAAERIYSILASSTGALFVSTQEGIKRSDDGGGTFQLLYAAPGPDQIDDLGELDDSLWFTNGVGVGRISYAGSLLWWSGETARVHRLVCSGSLAWWVEDSASGVVVARLDPANGNGVARMELGAARAGALSADDSGKLYVSVPGAIAISSDQAQTWEFKPIGISTVSTLAAKSGHAWAGLVGGAVASYASGDAGWTTHQESYLWGSYITSALHMRSGSEAFFGGAPLPNLFSTSDSGASFARHSYDVLSVGGDYPFRVADIQIDSDSRLFVDVLYVPSFGNRDIRLYRSEDGGNSWAGPETVYTGGDTPWRSSLLIDDYRGCYWVSSQNVGFFRRPFGSSSWTAVAGFQSTYRPVLDTEGKLFVVGNGTNGLGLYTLERGQERWQYLALPRLTEYTSCLAVDQDGCIWIGSDTGLHYSHDYGRTWSTYDERDGIASEYITAIAVDGVGENRMILVGTAVGASIGTIISE